MPHIRKKTAPSGAVLNLFKLLNAVLLVELINAAAGIDQLLLAGVEGVALRADLDGDVLLGGSGLDDLAAGAADGRALVIGMDSFFHVVHLMLGCPEAEYSEIQGATQIIANGAVQCKHFLHYGKKSFPPAEIIEKG